MSHPPVTAPAEQCTARSALQARAGLLQQSGGTVCCPNSSTCGNMQHMLCMCPVLGCSDAGVCSQIALLKLAQCVLSAQAALQVEEARLQFV